MQRLLAAKKNFELESLLKKLDGFEAVILDDLGYVEQSREEMEVLFTFFAERYERRSLLISSNLVFSQWEKIFQDPMTTMAAIDRLVHHSIILEFDGDSYRAAAAGLRPPPPGGRKPAPAKAENQTKKTPKKSGRFHPKQSGKVTVAGKGIIIVVGHS